RPASNEQLLDLVIHARLGRAEWIHVTVGAPRGRLGDFLAPADAQSRVQRGVDSLGLDLHAVLPAGLDAVLAGRVGAANDLATLDAAAGEEADVDLVVVVPAVDAVERAGHAAELGGHDHEGLI